MDKRLSQGELSMDIPLSDDSRASTSDIIADKTMLQDEMLAAAQFAKIHNKKLREFDSR